MNFKTEGLINQLARNESEKRHIRRLIRLHNERRNNRNIINYPGVPVVLAKADEGPKRSGNARRVRGYNVQEDRAERRHDNHD